MSKFKTVRWLIRKSVPICLVLISILIALLFGELIARVVVNPGDFLIATMIDDPILGQRIKPNTTGHDALGFRNANVPEQVDIVAIGDSQTYGVSAPSNGSWPYQLGNLLDKPVYNMALGGYGPLQYLFLAEQDAKKLRPRQLLVAFYFGNDLIDAYNLAHHLPYWNSWREKGSTEGDKAEEQQSAYEEPIKHFASLRNWLSRHSVLYSMMRITLFPRIATWEKDRMARQVTPDQQMIWTDPSNDSVRTIFTPQSRLSALDMQLPNVREGLQITQRAFSALQKDAEAQGTTLLFILIPTKERVYCRYLKNSGVIMPIAFIRLCIAEDQTKESLKKYFSEKRILYLDTTEAMEKKIDQHVQIYPNDSDGHPLATGYGVIAQAVYDAIRH